MSNDGGFMKSTITYLLLLLFLASLNVVNAQEDDDDDLLLPPRRTNAPKVGGAGGFTPVMLFWDVDALNSQLPGNVAKFDKSPMLLLGGGGYAYIMLMDNLRVGGLGLSGSSKTAAISGSIRREVEVGIGYGGVTFEYAIPLIERLDIVPGIMIGGGGMDITVRRDRGGFKSWDSLWIQIEDPAYRTDEYTKRLEGAFFVYQPSLYLEFALLRWVGLRAGVSYAGVAAPKWKLDNKDELAGVPSKINGQGLTISTGIFLGTFLY
jgi:hypothetical protein